MRKKIRKGFLRDLMSSDTEISAETMAEKYGCSTRTIRTVAAEMIDEGIPVAYRRNCGYYLSNPDDPHIQKVYAETENRSEKTDENRDLFEMGMLLLSEKPVSLNTMADRLFVSKSAVNIDMDKLVTWLAGKHVSVVKNVRGHQVKRDLFSRVLLMLSYIREKGYSVDTIDQFFHFLFGVDCQYLDVFKAVTTSLIKNGIIVTDDQTIQFVSQVMMKKYVLKDRRIPEKTRIDTKKSEMPDDLIRKLQKLLDLDSEQMEDIQTFFGIGIMGIQPESVRQEAQKIMKQYVRFLDDKEDFFVPAGKQEDLTEIISGAIMEEMISTRSHELSESEVIRFSPGCYELALDLKNIMGSFHYDTSSFTLSLLVVFFRDIVDEKVFLQQRIRIILLHTMHPMLTGRICSELERTADIRTIDLKVMSLYEFNALKSFEHPESVIVLDPETNGITKARQLGVAYFRFDPLYFERYSLRLYEKILHTADQMQARRIRDILQSDRTDICFEQMGKKELDAVVMQNIPEHTFALEEILVISTEKKDDSLTVIQMDQTFLYKGKPILTVLLCSFDHKNKNLLLLREMLLQKLNEKEIRQCTDIDRMEELLLDACNHESHGV